MSCLEAKQEGEGGSTTLDQDLRLTTERTCGELQVIGARREVWLVDHRIQVAIRGRTREVDFDLLLIEQAQVMPLARVEQGDVQVRGMLEREDKLIDGVAARGRGRRNERGILDDAKILCIRDQIISAWFESEPICQMCVLMRGWRLRNEEQTNGSHKT